MPLHSRRPAKPCQCRTAPRSSPPAVHSLLSPIFRIRLSVFSETCALFHFFGSQLSRVLSAVCALFRKKPEVHPYVVIPGSAGILPASVPSRFRAGRMPALPKPERDEQAHPLQRQRATDRGIRTTILSPHWSLLTGHWPLLISPLFPLHTNINLVSPLFPILTQKGGSVLPPKNVGAPTFLIFPLIFCTFLRIPMCPPRTLRLRSGRAAAATQPKRARQASPLQKIRNTDHRPRVLHFPAPLAIHHTPLPRLASRCGPVYSRSAKRGQTSE
jgi:hypothetical protein